MDMETIVSSVKKTGRLVTAEDGVKTSGIGAEIIARTMEMAMGHIEEVQRVGCPDVPAPFSPPLQDAYMPGKRAIVDTVMRMMGRSHAS
jgi:pyruvate/2-oxoglutarate/acetoin dehydrogenase E1 component